MARPSPFKGLKHGPTVDALVLDYEKGRTTKAWPLALVAVACSVFAIVTAFSPHPSAVQNAVGFVLALTLPMATVGLLATLVIAMGAPQRQIGLAVDAEGVWWRNTHDHVLACVPWGDLAAVGLCTAGGPNAVDLFFAGEVPDRLRYKAIESTPAAPTLPTRRVRIGLPKRAGAADAVQEAVRRHAPGLWIGRYDADRPTGDSPFSGVLPGPSADAAILDYRTSALGASLRMLIPLALGVSALGYVYFPAVFASGGHADTVEKIIALVIAGLFLAVSNVAGIMLRSGGLRRGHGIAVDATGFWRRDARSDQLVVVPWSDLVAVGLAGARTQSRTFQPGVNPIVAHFLELYPVDKKLVQQYPALSSDVVKGKPPLPNVTGLHFRIALPDYQGASGKIRDAMRRFAPQLWLGEYETGNINPLTGNIRPTD